MGKKGIIKWLFIDERDIRLTNRDEDEETEDEEMEGVYKDDSD